MPRPRAEPRRWVRGPLRGLKRGYQRPQPDSAARALIEYASSARTPGRAGGDHRPGGRTAGPRATCQALASGHAAAGLGVPRFPAGPNPERPRLAFSRSPRLRPAHFRFSDRRGRRLERNDGMLAVRINTGGGGKKGRKGPRAEPRAAGPGSRNLAREGPRKVRDSGPRGSQLPLPRPSSIAPFLAGRAPVVS